MAARAALGGSAGDSGTGRGNGHPLLGVRVSSAAAQAMYETSLSMSRLPWLSHHRVKGEAWFPAVALAELVRAAGEDVHEGAAVAVENLLLLAPLVVPEQGALRVQVVVSEEGRKAAVHAASSEKSWILCATADVVVERGQAPEAESFEHCDVEVDVAQAYGELHALGLEYGLDFQGVKTLRRGKTKLLGVWSCRTAFRWRAMRCIPRCWMRRCMWL